MSKLVELFILCLCQSWDQKLVVCVPCVAKISVSALIDCLIWPRCRMSPTVLHRMCSTSSIWFFIIIIFLCEPITLIFLYLWFLLFLFFLLLLLLALLVNVGTFFISGFGWSTWLTFGLLYLGFCFSWLSTAQLAFSLGLDCWCWMCIFCFSIASNFRCRSYTSLAACVSSSNLLFCIHRHCKFACSISVWWARTLHSFILDLLLFLKVHHGSPLIKFQPFWSSNRNP